MKLLKRILLAVDLDDAVKPLLSSVVKIARPFDSDIVLLHAIEGGSSAGENGTFERKVRQRLQEMASQLAEDGVNVSETVCSRGNAAREIITASDRHHVNLIVMSARSAQATEEFALGTTTERVMRSTLRPVLAVRPDLALDLTSIICPIDFSATSARGLENAIRLARAFHSRLHIMHVVKPATRYATLDEAWDHQWAMKAEVQAGDEAEREMSELLQHFDLTSMDCTKLMERGEPAQKIIAVAEQTNAGLIIMGSTGRTGLPYMLMGSTAVKVARHMPCALLTVKREQVLTAQLERNIADIRELFAEGQELLRGGFHQEALARFDRCLELDPHFAHAISAKAEVHERLGHKERADEYHRLAQLVRRDLWDQQVQASVRASHPLFSRHRA